MPGPPRVRSVRAADRSRASGARTMPGAERTRVEGFGKLENGLRQASDWYLWGPYLSERQWGTVREDYSADGDAWSYLPHDHARSRAYRWGEDGMAGFSRRRAAAVPGAGAVERPRPDPQGADVRPDRRRGQPRRGRQGVLVVPRRRSQPRLEPLALPLPAGAPSPTTTSSPRTAGGASTTPSTSCSTPAPSTRTATGSSRWTTRRPSPTDVLMTVQVTNAGSGRRHAARAADGVVPQHVDAGMSTPRGRALRCGDDGADRHRPPVPR